MSRVCAWCRSQLAATVRSDARTCSQRCRQALHRFERQAVVLGSVSRPMRLAYADPPYPGKSHYYKDHPDYAGEVDHGALLASLQASYDGWALSSSASALPSVLGLCVALGLEIRVAAWFRGSSSGASRFPASTWEPVIFSGGRQLVSSGSRHDSLIFSSRPRLSDPARVIGAKPAAFCYWIFQLLGAAVGDDFVDIYPGSGGVSRAWQASLRRSSIDSGFTILPGVSARPQA